MPNPAVNRTACKLRLQVPSAFGSGSRLPLRCAVMKVLLLFAAINTLMPSTSWAETGLVADYPELPADARKVVERSAACRHFADEIAGNGSERDRQVNRQIKKLRCNSLGNDANRIRQKYKSRPEVLRLMDESMA